MSESFSTFGYIQGCPLSAIPTPTKEFNMFEWSDNFVNENRNAVGQVQILIVRQGAINPTDTFGTPGFSKWWIMEDGRVTQKRQSRDFLINTKDYAIDAAVVPPKRGDQIHEISLDESIKYIYEVNSFNGEPSWRYSGTYRHAVRVHTKFLDKEPYTP